MKSESICTILWDELYFYFVAADHKDGAEITPAGSDATSRVVVTTIPVAPPANLVNPDRPVPMATVPAHINTASALTKQKLLQTIQMKEQQKLLEQTIAQQLGQSPEILAQALKNMIPVRIVLGCVRN